MNLGRWSAFVLLPVILLLERFSYYALRSVLFQDMMDAGADGEVVRTHVEYVTWMISLTPVLGGLVAIAIRPRWTLVAGLFLTALGYLLVFALGSGSLPAFGVLAIGMGLFRPSLWATLALAARDPEESVRNAAFVFVYAAANAGGIAGPAMGSMMDATDRMKPFAIVSLCGVVMLALAALLSLAVALAPRFGDTREPADPPFTGRGEVGALLVMMMGLTSTLAITFADSLQFEPFFRSGSFTQWVFYINPIAVVGVTILLGGALAVAAFVRRRVPALYLAAAGMAISALGCVPLLLLSAGDEIARTGAYLSILLMAVGEALLYPILVSRMAAGPHPRSATAVVAVWLTVSGVGSQAIALVVQESRRTSGMQLTGSLLAACAVISLMLAIGAVLVQWLAGEKLWGGAPVPADPADDAPTLAPV